MVGESLYRIKGFYEPFALTVLKLLQFHTNATFGSSSIVSLVRVFVLGVIAERFGIIGTINQLKTDDALVFGGEKAVRLLRRIIKYMHHPIRRLRAELILAYYDGKISREELMKLYKPTKYKRGAPDVKRNNALEALIRAAPQTHTHGATWDKENQIR